MPPRGAVEASTEQGRAQHRRQGADLGYARRRSRESARLPPVPFAGSRCSATEDGHPRCHSVRSRFQAILARPTRRGGRGVAGARGNPGMLSDPYRATRLPQSRLQVPKAQPGRREARSGGTSTRSTGETTVGGASPGAIASIDASSTFRRRGVPSFRCRTQWRGRSTAPPRAHVAGEWQGTSSRSAVNRGGPVTSTRPRWSGSKRRGVQADDGEAEAGAAAEGRGRRARRRRVVAGPVGAAGARAGVDRVAVPGAGAPLVAGTAPVGVGEAEAGTGADGVPDVAVVGARRTPPPTPRAGRPRRRGRSGRRPPVRPSASRCPGSQRRRPSGGWGTTTHPGRGLGRTVGARAR